MDIKISLILPVYNEEENLNILSQEIKQEMEKINLTWEAIFINDGSQDRSLEILRDISSREKNFKVIDFRRNFGQTAALSAGIDNAGGEIIIPMDSDLQNDPKDLSRFVSKIEEGYDVVSGWRKNRKDKLISRKIPSQIANYIISCLTKIHLHDYGCTMKAYRSKVIKEIRLYGEMHRFIPAYAQWYGSRVAEIIVNHRPRKFGKTKYGISRTFRVILDLFTVKFLTAYLTKPMHFFGKFGFYALFFSLISGLLAIFLRQFLGISFISTPLPLLTVFLILVALQFILMGLLAEIIIRNYFESQNKPTYLIKEKINFI